MMSHGRNVKRLPAIRPRCWWPRDERESALRDDALCLIRLLEETRELATAHPLCSFMIEAIRRRSRRRARSRELAQMVPQPPAREHDIANASREQWVASMAGIVFARCRMGHNRRRFSSCSSCACLSTADAGTGSPCHAAVMRFPADRGGCPRRLSLKCGRFGHLRHKRGDRLGARLSTNRGG